MLANEYFKDFRFRSFYIEDEMVCRMLVLFFQCSDSGWVSLSIDEGVLTWTYEKTEPELRDIKDIDDEFAWPVQTANELASYVGKKITDIYEYKLEGIEEGSIGVYFECGNKGFSVLEHEGCLFLFDGVYYVAQGKILLSRLALSI
ncbi:hypothetical protein ACQE32_15205 [Pantoea sp. FN0302]|uniref:hypothetical protein n=1 Tax=unclassified Pantoea TaxID=2630326 RepID=UPI003CF6D79E